MSGQSPVNFLLMQNSARTGKLVNFMLDMKDSIINREVPKQMTEKSGSTLKDVNLLDLKRVECLLMFD